MGDCERKNVEPLAARSCGDPKNTDALHRKLLRVAGESGWEERPLRE